MIIATALGEVFNGTTITYNSVGQSVNYHYGDQKELLAWINLKTKANARKYPLVWYILNSFTEHQGWYETDCTLVILQNTKSEWFNPTRQAESYTKIIDPVWNKIRNALLTNNNVQVMGDLPKRFDLLDKPNYGIDGNSQNLETANGKGKSVVTDIVDGRVIRFRLRIKAQCLIN
jgi:hypothetical protein